MLNRSRQYFYLIHIRNFHTTKRVLYFYEPDNKRGAKVLYDKPAEIKTGFINQSKNSLKILKEEFKKLGQELKEKFMFSPNIIYRNNEVDIEYKFTSDPKCLNQWIITTDKEYSLGNSTAKLELTQFGKGIFSGYLDNTVPNDGVSVRAGFVNMSTVPRMKSFFRSNPHMWQQYTHMIFRVRGDGRTYMLTLSGKQTYDMAFFDIYTYFLYTRGGPYWQYTRIPFSKFLFASKGTVQDTQGPLDRYTVIKIGISLADKIKGPFQLEIDYIGVEFDESHTEEHAYEMYKSQRPMM